MDCSEWIRYDEVHQFLAVSFPAEYRSVGWWLNEQLVAEEREGYVERFGTIGTAECCVRIRCDRALLPKEIGTVLPRRNGKFKAMTSDSRELDAECESVEEARSLLLRQPQFDPEMNWKSRFYAALANFKAEQQLFRSLEAELDCSEWSSLNALYLLPIKVVSELNAEYRQRTGCGHQSGRGEEVTFGLFVQFRRETAVSSGGGIMFALERLIGEDGTYLIADKIQDALSRSDRLHSVCAHGLFRGILKRKQPAPLIVDSEKREVAVRDDSAADLEAGCLVEFELKVDGHCNGAVAVRLIDDALPGFSNYVDIAADPHIDILDNHGHDGLQRAEYGLNGLRLQRVHSERPRPRNGKLDKWTLRRVISEHLRECGGTFNMHHLPGIVERTLDIRFRAQKFGFESLRAIFEDADILSVCRLDNASSTALVSTPERSKQTPSMQFIKNGFAAVLRKYDPHRRGYRMKRKGQKGSRLRAHFAEITGKALKPRVWFGDSVKVKDLIRKCNDIIHVDPYREPDGVWVLSLK